MLTLLLAFSELKSNRTFAFLYVVSLSLGLLGLCTLDALQISVRQGLNVRSKAFLSADLGVSARRPLKDEELGQITHSLPPHSHQMNLRESFTMVASHDNSRLIELRVIEPAYPYYGEVTLQNQGSVKSETAKDIFESPKVWAYPDFLLQMGLKIGDQIKIGEATFTISDAVLLDSAGAGSDIGFAPPIYLAAKYFADTRLVESGSTGFYTRLIQLPPLTDAEALAKTLNKQLADPEIQILTPRNSSEQIGRLLNYLSDYLSLAGLVALLLASVGQIFLLRNYFLRHLKDIAIFKSLGLTDSRIIQVYFFQVLILSLASVIPVLVCTRLALPLVSPLLSEGLHIDFQLYLPTSTILLTLIIALLQTAALSLPLLLETTKVKVQSLFMASANSVTPHIRPVLFAPAVFLFSGLTIVMSHSLKTAGLFLGLLIVSIFILALIFRAIFILIENIKLRPPWSLALRHATSVRTATFAAFLAIAIASLLANLIPQLEAGIRDEVASPSGVSQPALFLYDIQNEQLAGVKDLIATLDAPLMQTAPMIRARLSKVNDKPYVKPERKDAWSREKESENRSRNRGYNLSFESALTPSEHLESGKLFDATNTNAQISLEKKFADRMNLKIGDHLTFDVQGIDVSGEVVNFRQVRWTSFQPGFFIQFNPGPLNEAPKTYLATLGAMPEEMKNRVQTEIVRKFSNVAIIDVTRMIARILGIISQLAVALKLMAAFATVVGITILFFILYNQIYDRRKEANLLKVLGASEKFVLAVFICEVISITTLALALGTALSFVVSFGLSYFLFDGLYVVDMKSPVFITLAILCIAAVLTYLLLKTVFDRRASSILQSD
jgi:putative ABC transport system permease protein